MAESNSDDSNYISDIAPQLTEMKEIYERKISELHSEFSQLKDLRIAVIKESKILRQRVPKVFKSNPKVVWTNSYDQKQHTTH